MKTISYKQFANSSLNEARDINNVEDADKFIADVLKLGSRDNIFDKFMKKEGIKPIELTTLIRAVANRIIEKWT